MKVALISLLSVSYAALIVAGSTRDYPPIVLTSPKLKLVDGKSWAMDGKQFKKTMKFRLDVNKRRFGEKVGPNEFIGFYEFAEKKYSLAQLIELEETLMASNSVEDQKTYAALKPFLRTIMEEFIKLSQPFLEDARGAKAEMLALITEWAGKAHRTGSYLLAWGRSKEGEESEVIYTNIKTFSEFDQFLTDLVYFLETLMRSCPIATEQFKELLKKEQEHAHK